MKYIEEYLQLVEKEKLHKVCKEQKQMAQMIRKILTTEEVYIDEERVEKYYHTRNILVLTSLSGRYFY